MNRDYIEGISEIMKSYDELDNLQINEPLSKHTSFRVGGPASIFINPTKNKLIGDIIKYCIENSVKYFILGNGSNILASDDGYDGVIIHIGSNLSDVSVENNIVYAQAGANLAKVASVVRDNSLTGFEFAGGIPGTVGGAVTMNAGAYGGEMKDIVVCVDVLHEDGTTDVYFNEQMKFGYRKSVIKSDVVLGVCFELQQGQQKDITDRMKELMSRRQDKQPLEFPSAGSTFKRPEGFFAGKLIEDSGLSGYRIGGAMVSSKHCGFVINYDKATAKDIMKLISYIQSTVYDLQGVKLETEVKILE